MNDVPAGDTILRLAKLDAEISKKEETLRVLKTEYESIKDILLVKMIAEKTSSLEQHGIKIKLNESDVPQIKDWVALEKFVLRHKRLDLFQRRISVTTYREILQSRKEVPGVALFKKLSLSVTRG